MSAVQKYKFGVMKLYSRNSEEHRTQTHGRQLKHMKKTLKE